MARKSASRRKRAAIAPTVCEIPGCGYSLFIQKHRIHPGREGGGYILGNVIGLCPNHHAEADAGMIPPSVLFYYVQERIRRVNFEAEYEDYIAGTGKLEAAGPNATQESESSVRNGYGHGPHGTHTGFIAQRFITYLFTERFRPITKRRDFTVPQREPKIGKGNGAKNGKIWVYSPVYRNGRN